MCDLSISYHFKLICIVNIIEVRYEQRLADLHKYLDIQHFKYVMSTSLLNLSEYCGIVIQFYTMGSLLQYNDRLLNHRLVSYHRSYDPAEEYSVQKYTQCAVISVMYSLQCTHCTVLSVMYSFYCT